MAELPLRVLLLIVSVALPVKVTVVVDSAAVLVGRVAAEGAIVDRKRCVAAERTPVQDAAAFVAGRVAAEGAVVYRQRRMIVEDATARVIGISPTAGATVSDGEAGNGDGFTGRNVKHAARGVAVHC